MRFRSQFLWFGLLVSLLLAAGCAEYGIHVFEKQSVQQQFKKGCEPIAVISIAPAQDWLSELQELSSYSLGVGDLKIDQIAKLFPGTDLEKPITLILFPSKRQAIVPVIYLPVDNYEQFVAGLSRRVRLKRAFASSFMVGSQKILVKQVGDFAVFGTSLKQINAAPASPEALRNELPGDVDLAIKVKTDLLRESGNRILAKLVGKYLGDSIETINLDAGSIVLGLSIDSEAGIQLQTQFSPIPEDPKKFQQSLNDAIANQSLAFSSELSKNALIIDSTINVEQLQAAWALIGAVVTDSYRGQPNAATQQVSNSHRAPLPKITYINSGINWSSSSSSCSSRTRSSGVG